MAKILVTGGIGFIGTNLVHALRARKHDAMRFCIPVYKEVISEAYNLSGVL